MGAEKVAILNRIRTHGPLKKTKTIMTMTFYEKAKFYRDKARTYMQNSEGK